MKNFLGFVDVLNLYLNASSMAWEKRVVLSSCRHFKIRYKRIHVIQRQVFFMNRCPSLNTRLLFLFSFSLIL